MSRGISVLVIVLAVLGMVFFLLLRQPQATTGNPLFIPPWEGGIYDPLESGEAGIAFEEQFDGYANQLVALVNNQDPTASLTELERLMDEEDFVLDNCHELLHEIGYVSYDKYNDFAQAMRHQNDVCNSGYYHGVIEKYFGSLDSLLPALEEVCDGETRGTYESWECYHGVGHGSMYFTGTDVHASLEYCQNYSDARAQGACMNGVYMEVFNLDETSRNYYLPDSREPLTFCENAIEEGRTDCYLYAPTYYLLQSENDFFGAIEWCKEANPSNISDCILGVGSETMKRNMNDVSLVEDVCVSAGPLLEDACITGAILQSLFHLSDLKTVETQICDNLSEKKRDACKELASSTAQSYSIQ